VLRLGLGFLGTVEGGRMLKLAPLVERLGFDSIWMAETRFRRDAFTPLAAMATRTRRVRLGTCVINPFTRSPLLIAMSIATLDELAGGRAILGIGASGKRWIEERYGMPFREPISAMVECINIVRELVRGARVTYHGKVFKLRDSQLGFRPARDYIPIYVGATGPQMLTLSGRIADGVIFNGFTSPEYVANAVKLVERGVRRRSDGKHVEIAGCILTCVDRDSESARHSAKEILTGYLALPEMFRLRAQVGDKLLQKRSLYDRLEKVSSLYFRGNLEQAMELVDEELLDHLAISGSPRRADDKLREYLEAGLELAIICPVGSPKQLENTISWAGAAIRSRLND
jgi:5,10-methylenetetrahydromethanopterin reductase